MPLSVATWNINSVRLRIDLVRRFLAEHAAGRALPAGDEVPGRQFSARAPSARPATAHIEIHGQKGYHGVAIVSRLPLDAVDKRRFCGKEDARHIAATVEL